MIIMMMQNRDNEREKERVQTLPKANALRCKAEVLTEELSVVKKKSLVDVIQQ